MLTDVDIAALVHALDDDKSGSLAISELVYFVEHGLGGDDSSGGAAGGGAEVKRNKKRHENVRVADDLFKDGISDKPLRANATEYERRRQQKDKRKTMMRNHHLLDHWVLNLIRSSLL